MIEQNNFALLKLCFLLEKRKKCELAANRAQYRVSYYRKLKIKLGQCKKSITPSKWMDKNFDLARKLEKAKLIALKKQLDLIQLNQRLNKPISKALKNANARLNFQNNTVSAICVYDNHPTYLYTIKQAEFEEYAAQYEASIAMDKVLAAS